MYLNKIRNAFYRDILNIIKLISILQFTKVPKKGFLYTKSLNKQMLWWLLYVYVYIVHYGVYGVKNIRNLGIIYLFLLMFLWRFNNPSIKIWIK